MCKFNANTKNIIMYIKERNLFLPYYSDFWLALAEAKSSTGIFSTYFENNRLKQ